MKAFLKKLLKWIFLIFVPPIIAWLIICWKGLVKVATTGMCPAAPTDIPPYPCSLSDYILRMTVGPWALGGNIIIFGGWLMILGACIAIRAIVRRF